MTSHAAKADVPLTEFKFDIQCNTGYATSNI